MRLRPALALVIGAALGCGACGKGGAVPPNDGPPQAALSTDDTAGSAVAVRDAARVFGPAWARARESGDDEDLATLAVEEGAVGLEEGAADPALRKTALEAMAFAPGWAAVPFLAKEAADGDDDDARLALASLAALASRPRRAEDPEDVDELRAGCERLVAVAHDTARVRGRRVGAIRALRMMPCPKHDLPTDLDAK